MGEGVRLGERTRIGVAAILAGVAAACGDDDGSATQERSWLLRAGVSRHAEAVPTDRLVEGHIAFGDDLARAVVGPGATPWCPRSASQWRCRWPAGARGLTAAEIDQGLHFPATDRDAALNTLTGR
jgi:hypothetical protein